MAVKLQSILLSLDKVYFPVDGMSNMNGMMIESLLVRPGLPIGSWGSPAREITSSRTVAAFQPTNRVR